uniref:Jasmonate O-methyltransferase n=1 Tax=Oryza nivara TaxID=4536 RepID=A0A0E0H892_ORYNI
MELLVASQEAGGVVVVGMNSGDAGELSYANNSDMQRTIAAATRKERQEMAAAVRRGRRQARAIAIADLGCATGPNALLMAGDAVEAMLGDAERQQEAAPAEFHVFLNDLPSNDFNSVFRQKQKLVVPSNNAGGGLGEQVPEVAVVRRGHRLPPGHEGEEEDASAADLLGAAGEEEAEPCRRAADRRLVDSFDAPFYGPCPEELREAIREEGSFQVTRMELFEVSRSRSCQSQADLDQLAAQTSSTIRAVVEPMLGPHFGWDAMDALFRRYTHLLHNYYRHNNDQLTNVFLALHKI